MTTKRNDNKLQRMHPAVLMKSPMQFTVQVTYKEMVIAMHFSLCSFSVIIFYSKGVSLQLSFLLVVLKAAQKSPSN
jgi:hypothetical protein